MSQVPPECARLAAELRALQQRRGLSLVMLAEETAFSKSSWHRYLRGTALPPWSAVSALCRLAGEPQARVRALWNLAEAAWTGRAAVATRAAAPPRPAPASQSAAAAAAPAERPPAEGLVAGHGRPPRRRWSQRRAARALVVVTACAVVAAGTLFARSHDARPRPARTASAGFHVGCTGKACDGVDPGVALCGVEPETLLHEVTRFGAGLEVRYNPLCRAAWARVWNTQLGDVLTLSEPGRPTQRVTVDDRRLLDAFVYTPLIDVDGPLTACLTTPSGAQVCSVVPRP